MQDSLLLGTVYRRIKKQYILEGEVLAWDDDFGRMEPFYKIRRHWR